jgi:hypothetical protein
MNNKLLALAILSWFSGVHVNASKVGKPAERRKKRQEDEQSQSQVEEAPQNVVEYRGP